MKQLKVMAMVATLIASSTTLAAGVGVVDFSKVAGNSTYLKQQEQSLKQSLQPTITKLEQLAKELDALQQKAAQEGDKLKEADLKKMEQQYRTKAEEFNKAQQELQTRTQQGSQQIQSTFESRVEQVAEQLRKENQFDLVVDRSVVLSLDSKIDLTDKVIQRVNAIK